ncbi:MAG: hypothetical protein ACRDS9_00410 [Pseudonocardiaceae bacterium]
MAACLAVQAQVPASSCPALRAGSDAGPMLAELTRLFTDDSVPDEVTTQAGALLYRYFC